MEREEISKRERQDISDVVDRWVKITNQLSYCGFQKGNVYESFDNQFGATNWIPVHTLDGKVMGHSQAYQIYEDAYYEYLRSNPEIRDRIVKTASDVYDIQPSNTESGLDYQNQECTATHLQDIAVRRALTRLKLDEKEVKYSRDSLPKVPIFEGDHLVQIRGHETEGFFLNPGVVPFHKPDLILEADKKGWWNPLSVEGWYQSNKTLLVNPDNFYLGLAYTKPNGVTFSFNKNHYYDVLPGKQDLPPEASYVKGKKSRADFCGDGSIVEITDSPREPFSSWVRRFKRLNFENLNAQHRRTIKFKDLLDES